MQSTALNIFELLTWPNNRMGYIQLQSLTKPAGLAKYITDPMINQPGLALSGFYQHFAPGQLQIFTATDHAYLCHLLDSGQSHAVQHFLQQPIAGCLFTNNLHPPQVFLDMANHHQIAVLLTETPYHTVLPHITALLSYTFAHKHHVHGVLVEVHSMGILITGSSGIGKSETALELLSRGHRLVADDLVEIRKINSQSLIGSRNNYLKNKHFLEIRGVGILDINQLFGIKACLDKREIDLVIHLEEYIDGQMYERLGINHAKTELLAVTLPTMSVPVKPGRNIPIILETAALHFRNQRTLHGYPQHLLQKLV